MGLAVVLVAVGACALAQGGATRITVGDRVVRRGVKRFGINLGGQNFYDSGQMLKNLVARNPGFEGEQWQMILRCRVLTRTGCTTDAPTAWPSGFLDGGTFEIATGVSAGVGGAVRSSAAGRDGYTVTFAAALPRSVTDTQFVVVRVNRPGKATAGWWANVGDGGSAVAELRDLPPGSASRQAVRVTAPGRAVLTSYFDSLAGHSFVRMKGGMMLRFAAKPVAGKPEVQVHLNREGTPVFLDRTILLRPGWQMYTVPFEAVDKPGSTGTVGLGLTVQGATVLLDDVSLVADGRAENRTVFRDEVVEALRELRPGVLRMMDSGTNFGTSLDNWLQPAEARARAGYSVSGTEQEDVGIGLQEFLQLSEAVGAEPWVSLPAGFSAEEARDLVEFLGGPATSRYGALRAKLGHAVPWDRSFAVIHLELGNEVWNRGSFAGATMDAAAYGERAALIFGTMRGLPGFDGERYDLVAGSWAEMPAWTAGELKAARGMEDSVAIAPYLFTNFESAPGMEGVYGPMLAEPEQRTRAGGAVARQVAVVQGAGKRMAVYEVNLGTLTGAAGISQEALDRTVPTMGAGLAVADAMLLMLREQGVTDQCFFALGGVWEWVYIAGECGAGADGATVWGGGGYGWGNEPAAAEFLGIADAEPVDAEGDGGNSGGGWRADVGPAVERE